MNVQIDGRGRAGVLDVLAGLDGFGAVRAPLAGARAVQKYLNAFAEGMGAAEIDEDGVWGCATERRLDRVVKWYYARIGKTPAAAGVVLGAGPVAALAFLRGVPPYEGVSADEVAEAQIGWNGWVASGKPCGGSRTGTPTPDASDDPASTAEGVGDVTVAGGSSTLRYVGMAAAGAVLAIGIWWIWKRRQG
ncbi:MAG: hypothetical protein ABIG85_03330 [Chloroflexota bacterium]